MRISINKTEYLFFSVSSHCPYVIIIFSISLWHLKWTLLWLDLATTRPLLPHFHRIFSLQTCYIYLCLVCRYVVIVEVETGLSIMAWNAFHLPALFSTKGEKCRKNWSHYLRFLQKPVSTQGAMSSGFEFYAPIDTEHHIRKCFPRCYLRLSIG